MKFKMILATIFCFVAVSTKITRTQIASTCNNALSSANGSAVKIGGNGDANAEATSDALTINYITQILA